MCGVGGIVSSDGDYMGDSQVNEVFYNCSKDGLAFGGVKTRRPDYASSFFMDAAYHVDSEGDDFFVGSGEVGKAVVNAQYVPTVVSCLYGYRSYDVVYARSRSTSANYRQGIALKIHISVPPFVQLLYRS